MERIELGGWVDPDGLVGEQGIVADWKVNSKVKEGERMFLGRTSSVESEQLNTEVEAFTAYGF